MKQIFFNWLIGKDAMRSPIYKNLFYPLVSMHCVISYFFDLYLSGTYQTGLERGVYVIYPDKKFMPLKVRKFINILQKT